MSGKYNLKWLCEALLVSRSGYYDWLWRRQLGPRARANLALRHRIRFEFERNRNAYGRPRLAEALGMAGSRHRVARLMRQERLWARQRSKFRVFCQCSNASFLYSLLYFVFPADACFVQARGSGTKVTYLASFEEIWKVMPEIVTSAGLKFVSANREERTVLAQRGVTPFSYGENVAVFVEKLDDAQSSVEIVSKKAVQTTILAPNWTKPILEQLDKRFKRA